MTIDENIKIIEKEIEGFLKDEKIQRLIAKPSNANHIIRSLLQCMYSNKKRTERYVRTYGALKMYLSIVDKYPQEISGPQIIDTQKISIYEHIANLWLKSS